VCVFEYFRLKYALISDSRTALTYFNITMSIRVRAKFPTSENTLVNSVISSGIQYVDDDGGLCDND
jgi:hypothetical protein